LYSLLRQHANLGQKSKALSDSVKLKEQISQSSGPVHKKTLALLENFKGAQVTLFVVVMLGTCLVIGDGILTPAISVLSAMAGIQSEANSISGSVVTWVSAVILVLVFMMQRFGTNRVSFLFSPIMLVWFVATPIVGIYNIVVHYPSVFKAVSPHYIVDYFVRNQKQGWVALGGVVLCITGMSPLSLYLAFCLKQVDITASYKSITTVPNFCVYRSGSNVCRPRSF
jgi:KUP system potassium uptake protein